LLSQSSEPRTTESIRVPADVAGNVVNTICTMSDEDFGNRDDLARSQRHLCAFITPHSVKFSVLGQTA
jgi:hypothetical protein